PFPQNVPHIIDVTLPQGRKALARGSAEDDLRLWRVDLAQPFLDGADELARGAEVLRIGQRSGGVEFDGTDDFRLVSQLISSVVPAAGGSTSSGEKVENSNRAHHGLPRRNNGIRNRVNHNGWHGHECGALGRAGNVSARGRIRA